MHTIHDIFGIVGQVTRHLINGGKSSQSHQHVDIFLVPLLNWQRDQLGTNSIVFVDFLVAFFSSF